MPSFEPPPLPHFEVPPVGGYPVSPVSNPSGGSGGSGPEEPSIRVGIQIGMFALAAVLLLLALFAYWMDRKVAYVRVVDTPPGEAPEPIRRLGRGQAAVGPAAG